MKTLIFLTVIYVLFQVYSCMLVGGWSDVQDTNSETLQKYVYFATDKISSASNSVYKMRPIAVIKAKKQVVSGMKYDITFRIGATECKKNQQLSAENLNQCEFVSSEAPQICNAVVWDRPWIQNSTKVLKFSCTTETKETK